MSSKDLQVGDPVWAKMKGYPPWPAKIAEPPSDSKGPKNKKSHYVYFFGSENFAWILDEHISPHNESMLNTSNKKKPVGFQNGVEAIVKYSNTYMKKRQSLEVRKKSENDLPAKVKGKQVSEMQKHENIGTPSKKKTLKFEEIQTFNTPVKQNQSCLEEKKSENSTTSSRKKKKMSEINVTNSKNEKQVSVEKGKSEFVATPTKVKKLNSQENIETTIDTKKKKKVSPEKEKKESVPSPKKKKRTSEEEEVQFIIDSCKKEQSEIVNSSPRKIKQASEEKEVENADASSSKEENVNSNKTKKDENTVSFKKRKLSFEGKEGTENLIAASNEDKKLDYKEKGDVVASPKKRKLNNEVEKNENIVTVSKSNKNKQALKNKNIDASSNKVETLDSEIIEKNESTIKKVSVVRKNVKRVSPVKPAKSISQKRLIKTSTPKVPRKERSDFTVNINLPYNSQHPCPEKEIAEEASSEDLEDYEVPSKLKFGFIGLGMMGRKIVTRLLQSGHDVTVWNKTLSVCDKFISMGAKKAHFPAELIVNCDVTFSCVADPDACKKIIFCEHGVLEGFEKVRMLGQSNKGYVELSNIDPICSKLIAEAIDMKNGRYLEAPLIGTSTDVDNSTLIVIGAGNRSLFKDCISCFTSIGKRAICISSEIGYGTSMSLIVNMLSGTVCAALSEAVALTERLKLQKDDFLECLANGPLACKTILEKAHMMINSKFHKETALKLVQKDISLSLLIGDNTYTPTPVIAAANEVYKRARLSKYSEEDVSAVYKVAKY